ncbi:tetratricopeptide repeat protein [Alistipes sp.]|uniref:tetratricopeptide repeat protein n=1 Tax=Alistipes sp. TaxID=1872444 RepID=UPI003AB4B8EC
MKKWILTAAALFAVCSLFAQQSVTEVYNNAAKAYGEKQFAAAAEGFLKVIDEGSVSDDPDAAQLVVNAKKNVPICYYMMGGMALKRQQYDQSLQNFTKSAEYAELYGDVNAQNKANEWVARIYQIEGGEAFNNKDYAAAAEVFAKGYAANPKNTEMAIWLATCYCELGEYDKGMRIFESVAAMIHPKYADDVQKARELMALYTNNEVARLQAAGDYDGIIAMADRLLAENAESALAQKIRLQAYFGKKDYAKVIDLADAAAAAQTDEEDRSDIYFTLGAAYNAREMKPQAIAALRKVVAGPNVNAAKASIAELSK